MPRADSRKRCRAPSRERLSNAATQDWALATFVWCWRSESSPISPVVLGGCQLSTAEQEPGGGSDTGITPNSESSETEREREREREIQPTLSEPLTYSTTSTTLTSIWSIALTTTQDPFVGCCWRCQTSAGCHTHGTLSLPFSALSFYCAMTTNLWFTGT